MNLRHRIPVEQLEDERLTNIERKLVVAVSELRAPAGHTSRHVLAFAAAALAVGVAGVIGYKAHRAPGPRLAAAQPLTLRGGTLDLGDAQLTSSPTTDATVERTPTRTVVQMRRGTLDFAVTHDPDRIFVVRAGDTEIEDIGTKFRVDFDGHAAVAVSVREGEVRVVRSGASASLTAGHRWSTDGGAPVVVAVADVAGASPDDPMNRAPDDSTNAAADDPATRATGNSLGRTTDDPATRATGDSTTRATDDSTSGAKNGSAGPVPTGATPNGAAPRTTSPGSAVPSTSPGGPSSPTSPGTATSAVLPVSSAPRAAKATSPRSNARIALEKLAIEEPLDVGTNDTNTAIAKYLDLAVSMRDAQDKTQVLYSIAVVQHRAHQDKAALYTLSGVIKRHGGTAYRAALWLNVRIECMQHFDDECRQAADLYLRKVPDGPAAGIAQAILDEIERG